MYGLRNAAGQLYTTPGPPPANSPFNGGVACSPLGQVYTTTVTAGAKFVNGFMVSPLGELVITTLGGTNAYLAGMARNALGALETQAIAPFATDVSLAGQLLSSIGEVFNTTAAPATAEFSSAFDEGFAT